MKTIALCFDITLLVIHQCCGSRIGARTSSCYNHLIQHTIFGIAQGVKNCLEASSDQCTGVNLTLLCPTDQQIPGCCDGIDNNILYTMCNYTCKYTYS